MAFLDAKLPALIFDASGITLVNKLCSKKQMQTASAEAYTSENITAGLEIDYLCQSAFDFRFQDYFETPVVDNFNKYAYRAPGKFSVPDDKFYPPPRLEVIPPHFKG
ncbi:hypothetical protein ACXYMT_08035 [Salinimicrobium sp. CAU 1759]